MFKQQTIIYFVVFSTMLILISPQVVFNKATDPPNWVISDLFQAGRQNIFTGVANSQTVPPPSYIFTFNSAFSQTPKLAYGISEYRGKFLITQVMTHFIMKDFLLTMLVLIVQLFMW